MKTKYLFGAAAALMMAACSQDELVSVKQDGIAYSVTASKQTRAADSYCNNALPESFKVWARTTDGNLYINGDVIKNEGACGPTRPEPATGRRTRPWTSTPR